MSEENKKTTLKALDQMRGDDLYRARSEFAEFTPAQMNEQHGQSGKTRAQILEEYEAHDAKVQAAMDWIRTK